MPKKLGGKKLSAKEHRMWEHVHESTGSGAKATAVVRKSRKSREKKKR
jgi:hypothetical protein